MMGPFLLLIGLMLLYVAAKGKSPEFISAMLQNVETSANKEETTLAAGLGDWMKEHVWDQATNAIIRGLPEISVGPIHISKPSMQPTNKQGGTG
jgi:hypothetical protein